jgi:hypothetical protein
LENRLNVSYQEILAEYKAKHADLFYTTLAQQIAIKKLEDRVSQLETELQDVTDNLEAESSRAKELQELLDKQE